MTALDVEAARKVLLDSLPPRDPKWRIWVDGILERLEPCVTEDPRIEQIRHLCDEREQRAIDSPARTFYGDPFPAMLSVEEVRAALEATP